MAQSAGSPSCLRDRLASSLDAAASEGDDVAATILRLVLAAIRDRDTAARAEDRCSGCDDEEIVAILRQMAAQRETSSRGYDASGRPDMADREREEIAVLSRFLPPLMDDATMRAAARSVVEELDADCLRDMGRCIQTLKSRYPGQMDFAKAGAEVRDLLS